MFPVRQEQTSRASRAETWPLVGNGVESEAGENLEELPTGESPKQGNWPSESLGGLAAILTA
jgi:hypothetical protein